MLRALLTLGLAVPLLLSACPDPEAPAPPDYCADPVGGQVMLPRDDARHDVQTEWWYWTGHLQTDDGRWFGFQFTFFAIGDPGEALVLLNLAVTDVAAGTFEHHVDIGAELPDQPTDGYRFEVFGSTGVGGGGTDVLHGELPSGTVLDLTLETSERPMLQHGDGYFDYGEGIYTYYYTRPRMAAAGTITVGGETLAVTGLAWMDHQWGSLAAGGGDGQGGGWDWFGIQLEDGRAIMIANIKAGPDVSFAGGTIHGADCDNVELFDEDVTLEALGEWTSPHTGCVYPMGWKLTVGAEVFTITPVMEDQELSAPTGTYWEGAATVDGSVPGRAYAEMVGYCPEPTAR